MVRPIDANALQKQLSALNSYDSVLQAVARIDAAPTLSLNTLRDEIYQDAVAHGLWEDYDQKQKSDAEFCSKHPQYAFDQDAECRNECALYVCGECTELREARDKADAFSEELADVIIMSMSIAGKLGIDIDAAIRRKMEINKGRAWKHGKE